MADLVLRVNHRLFETLQVLLAECECSGSFDSARWVEGIRNHLGVYTAERLWHVGARVEVVEGKSNDGHWWRLIKA